MIKIGHIADSHFDERNRLQDTIDVHRAFLRQAREADVDLIVHSGDWFERRSTPAERITIADFLEDAMHIAPVFGVRGNHDVELDLSIFPRLDIGGDGVIIMGSPTAMPGSAKIYHLGDHSRRGKPGGKTKLGLIALPWFDKAQLVAGLDATVDAEQTRQLTIEAAQDLLTCLRAEATRLRSEGVIPILVAHVLVAGSEVSTGQTLIGTTVELAPGDLLDVGVAYVALGHIHKAQQWFDGRVAYAGSPNRCNFGESEPKGWRLVTLTGEGEFVSNEFIELPAREIILLESDWSTDDRTERLRDSGINICFAISQKEKIKEIKGALVRFRYRIRSQDLHLVDEQAIEQIFIADGAEKVQIECVVKHDSTARAPEIVGLKSTTEKLDAFLKTKEIEVGEKQRERLHVKLSTLEGGTHATQ